MTGPARFLSWLLLFCSVPVFGQFGRPVWLEGEFRAELEPAVQDSEDYPLTKEEAASRILEEALYVFSGMIYGFRFVYVPPDETRRVKEEFLLEPVYQLAWGDPGLQVRQSRKEEDILIARVRYNLEEYQVDRIEGWKSNVFPTSSGRGSASILMGYKEKVTAIQKAVKEAIREYARQKVYNKPRRITGEVLLMEIPRIIIDAGSYHAFVKVKLKKVTFLPYSGY